jgi:hypothetical protein
MLLGVKYAFQKKGVEGLLYVETFRNGIKKGYLQAECSWILENNVLMQHGIEAMGGEGVIKLIEFTKSLFKIRELRNCELRDFKFLNSKISSFSSFYSKIPPAIESRTHDQASYRKHGPDEKINDIMVSQVDR